MCVCSFVFIIFLLHAVAVHGTFLRTKINLNLCKSRGRRKINMTTPSKPILRPRRTPWVTIGGGGLRVLAPLGKII